MRPIDADALKTKIQKIKAEALEHGFAPKSVCGDILLNFLDNAPTIEAKPIIHAHWKWVKIEDVDSYFELAECSNCRGQSAREYPYCRHCGAQMDEEKNKYRLE